MKKQMVFIDLCKLFDAGELKVEVMVSNTTMTKKKTTKPRPMEKEEKRKDDQDNEHVILEVEEGEVLKQKASQVTTNMLPNATEKRVEGNDERKRKASQTLEGMMNGSY